jgi:2-desacetyl-2-hydroxyethyl bacteriochlorophyllide A dehydrogenase
MKALVYHGVHQMAYQDWPDPHPRPEEALVAVRAVGICGSDVHGYTGESGRRTPPLVMGHEATGEVVSVGSGVTEATALAPGARVAIRPNVLCGACNQCRAGHPHRCRNRWLLGVHRNGAMAERVAVPPDNLVALPDTVTFVHGALAEPLAVALHAVRLAGDLTDQSVLIAGSGPIGLLALVAALRAGARVVAVTDLIPQRRATALALGAAAALDPTRAVWKEELADIVGSEEIDVALDAVGVPATMQQAIEAVRPGGTVIAIGGWQRAPIDLVRVVAYEIQIKGSINYTPDEFEEACNWLCEGWLNPGNLVTHIRPLSEGAAAFEELVRHPGDFIKVVLTINGLGS